MNLGDFIGRNRTAILGTTLVLALAGMYAALRLPVAIFPEVEFHRIGIIARTGNLPIEQTMTAVTQPLENAVTAVPGIETIRSMTTRGGAQVDLLFDWDADMLRALQRVQAAVDEARSGMPAETEIEARLLDSSAFPIVGVAVSSTQRSLAQLSDFVLYEAAPQLRTIPGVYRVELNGAKVREYTLTVDPEALVQHRLELSQVESALHDANIIAAGGRVHDGYQLTLVVVRGQATEPTTLLDTVVTEDQGVPVTLRQVARLDSSLREDFTRASANGTTAVLVGVSRQASGNSVDIAAAIAQRLTVLAAQHPEYEFSTFYNQADLVHAAVASVRDSIIVGILLAVVTIFFFIADVRITIVAAAVIPATVLITCLLLRLLGMSFNLMTLGGIAAGVGLVLDDAIVVVENLHRYRISGHSAADALRLSLAEITRPLIGSTLTPVAVLLPLALLTGIPGAFFRPLAVTMAVALLVSLFLALSFTPALAALLQRDAARQAHAGPGDRIAAWLSRFYAATLGWTLSHKWVALFPTAAILAVAVVAYQHVETGFVPEMDEGAFVLDYWSPPGTSVEETNKLLTTADAVLQATPEVVSFSRRTGSELGFFLTETNRGDYAVRLRADRSRSIEAVIEDVREQIHGTVPGLRVEFVQILQDMLGDLSGAPSPIEVKLFGKDQRVLEQTARTVGRLLSEIPGIVDNFDGITVVGPTQFVDVDEQRAKLVGLSAAAVQQWLETAMTGRVVGRVLEGDRAIPLRLWYPERFRNLDALPATTLVAPGGRLAPLAALARLSPGAPSTQHTRENLRQLIRITARLDGRDLGSATAELQRVLAAKLVLPAGVTLEYGGLYASQQKAFSELALVFVGSLVCVGLLLLAEFGSLAAVIAIILGSSLAVSGSLTALWLTGTALNVASIVGMIMVVGIVAKNGILLLDFAGRAVAGDSSLSEALVEAGTVRLRPILMTSLAALAGLAPLAAGIGAGSQMQQPLAIAILGGVSVSMLFSLIGIPLLYDILAPHDTTETRHAPTGG